MRRHFVYFLLCAGLCATPILGATIAQCTPTFSACAVPENILLQLPAGDFAIAGDVILVEPDSVTVSDVFRIFNNLLDTGLGTGLGDLLFLYSVDDGPLPDPSTYSANAVTITEDPSGFTHYLGNGTDYLLNAPEPSTISLCAFGIAMTILVRRRRKWPGPLGGKARIIAVLSVFLCSPAFAQVTINLAEGPVTVSATFDLPPGRGPAQTASGLSALAAGLAFYTARYPALGGVQLPFNIVGTDPSLGANTTTISTVLVPLKFVFPNTGSPTLDGANVIAATQNSPIFLPADYMAGPVDLGVTQYGDALQRAQFWNLPGFSSGYHVLLGTPSVAPAVTIAVPAGQGNAYPLSNGGLLGVVDTTFFEQSLVALLPAYTANQLPIFTTDNVFLGTNGVIQNCCILGFHASQGPPAATAKTWIYAAYTEPGTFGGDTMLNVQTLSHEVAEWLNDPFVGAFAVGFLNLIPPAVLPGQGGACIVNFETGDPLESPPATFTKTTNSTVYQLQDEVTLPWYLHTTPSFSVNGWYTFQNTTAIIPLVINSPASIAGTYTNTAKLSFAPISTTVTGDVAYVGRGCPADSISTGSPADPYLADPKGKIALIDRGACAVSLKVDAAAKAGAIGVLIGLVAPGDAISFTYAGGSDFVPSLVITQSTSNAIKGALATSTVNATLSPNNAIPPSFSTLCGPG
jgi:PA domain